MLKYRTKKVSVTAGGESRETILSVKEGQKVKLLALGKEEKEGYIVSLEVYGTIQQEIWGYYNAGFGNFVPLNQEIEGPTEVVLVVKDIYAGTADYYFTLAYEE